MNAIWILLAIVLLLIAAPLFAFLWGKYAQVGRLSGTKAFLRHKHGRE